MTKTEQKKKQKWPTKKLGEVIELAYGKGISKNERHEDGQYIVYGANGELGRTDKFLVEGEAIIVGRKGSVGELHRVSGKLWPSDVTYYIFGNDQIDVDYLFNFLKSQKLQRFAAGVKPGLNRNRVYELEIPLPPLDKQKRIVKVLEEKLGKVKEAIRLRQDAIADTEKILSAKLSETFAEGKEKGWDEKKIINISDINPKKSEVSKLPDDTRITFVPMAAVSDVQQKIIKHEIRLLGDVKKGYTYFKNGDLLFAKITPCMENGKVAIAEIETEIGFGTTEFHVIRPKKTQSNIRFLYYILASKKFREEAEKKMTGSAGQKRVPKDFIENYRIAIPDIKTQEKIVKELDELNVRVMALRALQDEQLADLKSLERAYLHEAFNGELV